MKVIHTNSMTSVSASSENTQYPIANVLDEKPARIWRAVSGAAVVTLTTSGPTQAVALFGTNMYSGSIEVKSGGSRVAYQEYTSLTYDRLWMNFTGCSSPSIVITMLSADGSPCEIGVVRAGDVLDLPAPEDDIQIGRDDASITWTYADGSLGQYGKARPRTLSLNAMMTASQMKVLDTLYAQYGHTPFPWDILEDADDPMYWIGFYHMIDPPSHGYKYRNRISVNMQLREAI